MLRLLTVISWVVLLLASCNDLPRTSETLSAQNSGQSPLVIVPGPVPAGLEGFPLSVEEVVLVQGWLDRPLSFTRAEAEAKVRDLPAIDQTTAKPGALARGRLKDLKPGWQAIPVDGVPPTPETVWSGRYPLSNLTSIVYRSDADHKTRAAAEHLRATAQPPPDGWIRLTVAGDFMLARGVSTAMHRQGTLYPVAKVKDHLASADLTFVNLESPIGVKGQPLPGKEIWFRAPPEAVEVLKAVGVDAVALANNHILDYDTENFLETIERLEGAGIKYAGGGRDLTGARRPTVLEAKGVKVAFLAYSQFADLFFDWNYRRSFAATGSRPGVAGIREDWLAEDIKKARVKAGIVAVAFHWGEEFVNYPSEEQRRLARLAIDLGADLVLGFHPHAIQGFETYRGGFIAYSTGNFIMDRQVNEQLARESMILDFQLSSQGVRSVKVHPVWIKDEQPYIMTGAEGEWLMDKMRQISGWLVSRPE